MSAGHIQSEERHLTERAGYPSGDEDRDTVIELLCDEWPVHLDYLEWDDRCAVVVWLLDVLDRKCLVVTGPVVSEPFMAGDPPTFSVSVTAEELGGLLSDPMVMPVLKHLDSLDAGRRTMADDTDIDIDWASLTEQDVLEQVERWKANLGDNEHDHAGEDRLYLRVLRAVAAGAAHPDRLAAAVLMMDEVEYDRWYA